MPASVKEKINPNTVIQKLQGVQNANSGLNARALDSYAQKHPDYIAPDYQAGKGYEHLVYNLSHFNKALVGAYDDYVKKERANSEILGQNTRASLSEEDKKLTWEQFKEKYPDHADDLEAKNYYIGEAYEKTRLNTLVIDYEKGFHDSYTQNGLQNSTDPKEVNKFIDDYTANFIKENQDLLSGVHPDLVQEHFTQYMNKAKEGIAKRHTQDVASQWENKLLVASTDKVMAQIDTFLGVNGRISNIVNRELQDIHTVLKTNLQDIISNGIRSDKAPQILAGWVQSLVFNNDNTAYLKLLDMPLADGVIPSSLPEIAKLKQSISDTYKAKAQRDWQHSRAVYEASLKDSKRLFEEQGIRYALDPNNKGIVPTFDNIMFDVNGEKVSLRDYDGISPTNKQAFLEGISKLQKAENEVKSTNPYNKAMSEAFEASAKLGELNYDEAFELSVQYGNPNILKNYNEGFKNLDDSMKTAMKEPCTEYRNFVQNDPNSPYSGGRFYKGEKGKNAELTLFAKNEETKLKNTIYEDVARFREANKRNPTKVEMDDIVNNSYNKVLSLYKAKQERVKAGNRVEVNTALSTSPATQWQHQSDPRLLEKINKALASKGSSIQYDAPEKYMDMLKKSGKSDKEILEILEKISRGVTLNEQ